MPPSSLNPQQQALLQVLTSLPVKLQANGSVEYGDELKEVHGAGEVFQTPDGKYKLKGLAPKNNKKAGIVILDTQTRVQASRRLEAEQVAQAPNEKDFFDNLPNQGNLLARVNTDLTIAATHLMLMIEETLGKTIPRANRASYIEQCCSRASSLKADAVNLINRDVNAVLASDKELDAKIANRLTKHAELYLFRVLIMAKSMIEADQKDQAFTMLRDFSRRLRKVLQQTVKAEQPPAKKASDSPGDSSVDEVMAGLQAAANATDESSTAIPKETTTNPAKLLTESSDLATVVHKLRETKTEGSKGLKRPIDIAKDYIAHCRAALNDRTTDETTLLQELQEALDLARGRQTAAAIKRQAGQLMSFSPSAIRQLGDSKQEFIDNAKNILMYVLNHSQSEIKKQDAKGAKVDLQKVDNFAKDFLKISKQLSLLTTAKKAT